MSEIHEFGGFRGGNTGFHSILVENCIKSSQDGGNRRINQRFPRSNQIGYLGNRHLKPTLKCVFEHVNLLIKRLFCLESEKLVINTNYTLIG